MARAKMLQWILQARRIAYVAPFCAASTAYAGALTNLDQRAYTFNITVSGETQKITLEPGRTYRSIDPVPMKIQADDGVLTIDTNEEYSIRKGKILLQRRIRQGERN